MKDFRKLLRSPIQNTIANLLLSRVNVLNVQVILNSPLRQQFDGFSLPLQRNWSPLFLSLPLAISPCVIHVNVDIKIKSKASLSGKLCDLPPKRACVEMQTFIPA